MTIALIRAVKEIGAHALFPWIQSARVDRECILGASKEQLEATLGWELERMKSIDAYIAVRGSKNVFENSDLPADDIKLATNTQASTDREFKNKMVHPAMAYTIYGTAGKNEH